MTRVATRLGAAGIAFGCALLVLPVLIATPVDAQEWSLESADPSRFCPADTVTTIYFTVAEASPVRVEIWSPDTTEVVRTLVDARLKEGFHAVVWNGRDEEGVSVRPDLYLCRMTAGKSPVLFEMQIVLEIYCAHTPRDEVYWGRIKALWR